MIKVINKKVYNTEKAILLTENWNGLESEDVNYFVERLYIARNGSFFLYGAGGPLSIYSESDGRETWGISKIIPMTNEDTFQWLQENGETEIIEEYLSHILEEV